MIRSIAALVGINFLRHVLAFAFLASAVWLPTWSQPHEGRDIGSDTFTLEQVENPGNLLAANDCWTGEAPADMAGVVPGHVVVTVDNIARLGGPRMVAKALEQVFDGADHGIQHVHGFCR